MLRTFELTIGNNNNDYNLQFNIFKTDIAQLWANEILQNYPIYESDRFTNWPNNVKTASYYEYYLKHYIDIIVNHGHPILLDRLNFQDALNKLHKHFEDIRGHVDFPSQWYNTAPAKVKESVDKLNILIHEYENFLEEEKQTFRNPTIVCTFKDRPKYDLQDNHYKHFTHKWEYGTVYINYCEVGKPLLDVFKDQDTHAEAIRPQSTWSADFMIKFGPTVPNKFYKTKDAEFWKWYKDKNFDFKNPAIGMIPVAHIKNNIDILSISNYNKVINVSCRK
tara:strand:+ start:30670 stop:31503 length:834 start_codon:yes stop_codon:yes gene_type:complete